MLNILDLQELKGDVDDHAQVAATTTTVTTTITITTWTTS
ncbi:class III lanthipeptide [Streptomyces sp. NBC_01275]|nr:class III lanthipeptide [Streptomyces sp. NBC_01275]MCX4760396.1 class III lanthipeptide [Streptomyces sp. NBC_01275]